jgi:hypothetical protein
MSLRDPDGSPSPSEPASSGAQPTALSDRKLDRLIELMEAQNTHMQQQNIQLLKALGGILESIKVLERHVDNGQLRYSLH